MSTKKKVKRVLKRRKKNKIELSLKFSKGTQKEDDETDNENDNNIVELNDKAQGSEPELQGSSKKKSKSSSKTKMKTENEVGYNIKTTDKKQKGDEKTTKKKDNKIDLMFKMSDTTQKGSDEKKKVDKDKNIEQTVTLSEGQKLDEVLITSTVTKSFYKPRKRPKSKKRKVDQGQQTDSEDENNGKIPPKKTTSATKSTASSFNPSDADDSASDKEGPRKQKIKSKKQKTGNLGDVDDTPSENEDTKTAKKKSKRENAGTCVCPSSKSTPSNNYIFVLPKKESLKSIKKMMQETFPEAFNDSQVTSKSSKVKRAVKKNLANQKPKKEFCDGRGVSHEYWTVCTDPECPKCKCNPCGCSSITKINLMHGKIMTDQQGSTTPRSSNVKQIIADNLAKQLPKNDFTKGKGNAYEYMTICTDALCPKCRCNPCVCDTEPVDELCPFCQSKPCDCEMELQKLLHLNCECIPLEGVKSSEEPECVCLNPGETTNLDMQDCTCSNPDSCECLHNGKQKTAEPQQTLDADSCRASKPGSPESCVSLKPAAKPIKPKDSQNVVYCVQCKPAPPPPPPLQATATAITENNGANKQQKIKKKLEQKSLEYKYILCGWKQEEIKKLGRNFKDFEEMIEEENNLRLKLLTANNEYADAKQDFNRAEAAYLRAKLTLHEKNIRRNLLKDKLDDQVRKNQGAACSKIDDLKQCLHSQNDPQRCINKDDSNV